MRKISCLLAIALLAGSFAACTKKASAKQIWICPECGCKDGDGCGCSKQNGCRCVGHKCECH